ncbi:ABC transporter permease [Paenibacillus alkaliterrae]|uniref:ABC transporter permease n=1 Tax=Paenibacillus alkaliterrae TaxID=320909 RepID=UPI001F4114C5|nr:ABC transporter permease [Paenibacillus alkaliterrae]MCF2936854.1 ABC transporter permease [Paenibacillus alkaliterrae]
MRACWITVYYELLKYSRMRSVLIILIGLPLLLILLLGSAFDREIKPAKVALFVDDQGEMRSGIDTFWSDESIAPYIKQLPAASEKEVQDLVTEGIADYGVYIPSGFSKRLLAGEEATWKTFSGRYGEKNMAADAVINSYMTNLNLQLAAMATLGPDQMAGRSQASGSVETKTSGIVIGNLGTEENQLFGPTNSMQYYSAAYLIMFLLFGGMSAAIALLDQKESGTLQRLYGLPSSFGANVFGIIVGAAMLAALQALVIISFTTFGYGVDWGGHFFWIAWICLLTTAAGSALAIIIASFAKTRKTMQTLFMILVFVMTFLSGGMMAGIENMIGNASKWTINHWANVSLRAIMSGSDTGSVWHEIGILAMIALILSLFAVLRLSKVVKQYG